MSKTAESPEALARAAIAGGLTMGQHLRSLPGAAAMSPEQLQVHGKAYAKARADAEETQAERTARALKRPKQWKTKTPGNAEAQERAAIQDEAKSKGSVKFP